MGKIVPELAKPAPRNLCTDCGLSRMKIAKSCGQACQFIQPDYPAMEHKIHGRQRGDDDELFFGPFTAMHRAVLRKAEPGAQWTGLTTKLAETALRSGHVDAVLCVGPDPKDRWKPQPVIITDADDMAEMRGMRMGYAPVLALLEEAARLGYRRLALIGIPCQVYALRAIEAKLGLERLYVIGTPCSDNTTTENFHEFLARLSDRPDEISYLEFRADYHVELRFDDGHQQLIPFLKLPLADLPNDFFPTTCRTCVDYTNVLADITVGYMAGTGEQWVIIRNSRGQELLDSLGDLVRLSPLADRGRRKGPVTGFLENTRRAAGGLPLRRMPGFMRGVMGWLMPRIGPKGLEFARARVEMKAIETVLHLRRTHAARMKAMVPDHVWSLVARYGLTPRPEERNSDQ
ncbi:MAG: Coenzyme F420 hydrogenase/dehydrogenase, beta subunit C-terminal domain [Pseudomonadota bacterium]